MCNETKRKPEIAHYYNMVKEGGDMLDKMLRQYSAQADSRRGQVAVFYNILDMAVWDL